MTEFFVVINSSKSHNLKTLNSQYLSEILRNVALDRVYFSFIKTRNKHSWGLVPGLLKNKAISAPNYVAVEVEAELGKILITVNWIITDQLHACGIKHV